MWNQLAALDFLILEEHTKAGSITGEWFGNDTSILERVPGVASLVAREAEKVTKVPKPVAPPRQNTNQRRDRYAA